MILKNNYEVFFKCERIIFIKQCSIWERGWGGTIGRWFVWNNLEKLSKQSFWFVKIFYIKIILQILFNLSYYSIFSKYFQENLEWNLLISMMMKDKIFIQGFLSPKEGYFFYFVSIEFRLKILYLKNHSLKDFKWLTPV